MGLRNHPLVFGRPFKMGAISGAPIVMVDGVLAASQADVEQRWPDGSVRFAVISVTLPFVMPNSGVTLTFGSAAASTE
jgi:hypothetical protein